jgi:hypothetical protein
MSYRLLASFITGSMLLSPAAAFAASAATTDITEEDVMNAIVPQDAMMDRGGGGYGIAPYYGGGVVVDASVTKEVTPDFVSLNAYCDVGRKNDRDTAKATADQIYNDIKNGVGKDGRVRRSGPVSVYPYYDGTGTDSGMYTANVSIMIRILNMSAAQRISDLVESKDCGLSWDVRLTDPQSFEMDVIDELTSRVNKRKAVFEKLLGKKLTNVLSASLYTWADGYSTYDPETNKVDATTTLNITFDLGSRATLPKTTRSTRTSVTPKG